MKYIKILQPIALKNLFDQEIIQENTDHDGKPITSPAIMDHKTFLIQRIGDQKLSANMEALKTQVNLKKAVNNASSHVILHENDWQALLEVIKEPSTPYNPVFAYCLLPFMDAVEQAADELETKLEAQ
jgi:hypothetical protein